MVFALDWFAVGFMTKKIKGYTTSWLNSILFSLGRV